MPSGKKLTFLFAPLSAWGHISPCTVIASALKQRYDHRIVFLTNESWKNKLISYGFEEETYERSDSKSKIRSPSEYWTELVDELGPLMRLSSVEKIGTFGLKAYTDMVSEVMEGHEQIQNIVERVSPDVIVIDNYILCPALVKFAMEKQVKWIRLRTASPVEINQKNVPPQNSGYRIEGGDPAEWSNFSKKQNDAFNPLWKKFSEWFAMKCPNAPLPENGFIFSSPYLNLYVYPKEIDYIDRRPMPPKWLRIDALVRSTVTSEFEMPTALTNSKSDKIIYLSLGTFGSADLNLMKDIVKMLSETPYKFIVCKGPFHEKYELPGNMWGDATLPQTSILPLVDAVICHGANSTLNECFYFGKPMLILPFFGDEYDNAQRIQETGYGLRLHPYNLNVENVNDALRNILDQSDMRNKMILASERIQKSDATKIAVESILNCL